MDLHRKSRVRHIVAPAVVVGALLALHALALLWLLGLLD